MSVLKIAQFLRIGGSFGGGRHGDRRFNLACERDEARGGRVSVGAPVCVAASKPVPRQVLDARARGMAAFLF